jgi:hypothetical protein
MGRLPYRRSDPTGLERHEHGRYSPRHAAERIRARLRAASRGESGGRLWNPAGSDTVGLLYRLPLQSKRLIRIGKEVDRLAGDEGATLTPDQPVEYERDDLTEDIEYLAGFPQAAIAADLGISERGWRRIIKGDVTPLAETAERIREIVETYRLRSRK